MTDTKLEMIIGTTKFECENSKDRGPIKPSTFKAKDYPASERKFTEFRPPKECDYKKEEVQKIHHCLELGMLLARLKKTFIS